MLEIKNMSRLPILENPEFDVESLTIASVDELRNEFDVMFDLHGTTIESKVSFWKYTDDINIDIESVYVLDGGYAYLDSEYFEDIIPNMRKLFIDEYIFNNVVIKRLDVNTKLAILLYRDIRFLCDVSSSLCIQMAFNIDNMEKVDLEIANQHKKILDKAVREYVNINKINKLSNMEVQILKMYEAAVDNTQYFVRLRRNDVVSTSLLGSTNVLEYACYQTKHHTKEECLGRAWMMASYLVQFSGETTMDCVKLINFTDEEIQIIKSDDNFTTALGV